MADQPIQIEVATEPSAELVDAVARLLPLLTEAATPPGFEDLAELLRQPNVRLLLAKDGRTIAGTLTLVTVRLPSGTKAVIEDVIVDEAARGRGVGLALVEAALHFAELDGAEFVDLTSNPSRVAANALYRRAGFEQRTTNVYRYSLVHSA